MALGKLARFARAARVSLPGRDPGELVGLPSPDSGDPAAWDLVNLAGAFLACDLILAEVAAVDLVTGDIGAMASNG